MISIQSFASTPCRDRLDILTTSVCAKGRTKFFDDSRAIWTCMVIYKHHLTDALSVVSTLTYQSFVNKIYFVKYSYFNTKMLCIYFLMLKYLQYVVFLFFLTYLKHFRNWFSYTTEWCFRSSFVCNVFAFSLFFFL